MLDKTYDATKVMGSFTGFEEIAVTRMFGMSISDMGNTWTIAARAMTFVLLKRDGMTDKDAFRTAMEEPASVADGRYVAGDASGESPAGGSTESGPQ